jgi:hypothetical protein
LNPDWIIVRNYEQFIDAVIKRGIPNIVSFDHDLGPEAYKHQTEIPYDQFTEKTGYHCAKWFINYCIDYKYTISPKVYIHSMNPVGTKNIESLFTTYEKIYRRT